MRADHTYTGDNRPVCTWGPASVHMDLRRTDRLAHARARYDRRRDAGDGHAAALRNLFSKFLGQLHHCLATCQRYDPNHARDRWR